MLEVVAGSDFMPILLEINGDATMGREGVDT